ncbi:MAG: hypothetical protein ILP16_08205, partial [Spirochaetales bacterium]|nr:hypothetical protein [Spirochaetales bacterium]
TYLSKKTFANIAIAAVYAKAISNNLEKGQTIVLQNTELPTVAYSDERIKEMLSNDKMNQGTKKRPTMW